MLVLLKDTKQTNCSLSVYLFLPREGVPAMAGRRIASGARNTRFMGYLGRYEPRYQSIRRSPKTATFSKKWWPSALPVGIPVRHGSLFLTCRGPLCRFFPPVDNFCCRGLIANDVQNVASDGGAVFCSVDCVSCAKWRNLRESEGQWTGKGGEKYEFVPGDLN